MRRNLGVPLSGIRCFARGPLGFGAADAHSRAIMVMASSKAADSGAVVERSYIDSGLPYDAAIEAFESALGHFDGETTAALVGRAAPWPDVEAAMARMAGPSGLMIFDAFDQGVVASLSGTRVRGRLYMVGNPAVAAQIVRIDVRACLYVPFRVAIHQGDGAAPTATISYDRPSSSLGTLGRAELQPIGQALDQKIEAVIQSVRRRA
jgi:hypothetical protein